MRIDDRISGNEAIRALREQLGFEWRVLNGYIKQRQKWQAKLDSMSPPWTRSSDNFSWDQAHEKVKSHNRSVHEHRGRAWLIINILRRARESNLEWF